jgi:hypothetical protein
LRQRGFADAGRLFVAYCKAAVEANYGSSARRAERALESQGAERSCFLRALCYSLNPQFAEDAAARIIVSRIESAVNWADGAGRMLFGSSDSNTSNLPFNDLVAAKRSEIWPFSWRETGVFCGSDTRHFGHFGLRSAGEIFDVLRAFFL